MTSPEQAAPMGAAERRSRMLAVAVDTGFVRVTELAAAFAVSEVTVRADLAALETEGAVRRVHGGAVPVVATGETPFETAVASSAGQKQRIGTAVAAMVRSGQSILLDVGSTTHAVARALRDRDDLVDVTVITNGLRIALELEPAIPRISVVVTGGTLRPLQHSLIAPLADPVLDLVHADLAVVGCNGVDPVAGLTNVNLPEAAVKARMLERSDRRIVVAESAKLGRVHLATIAPLAGVDALVTDHAPVDPDAYLAAGLGEFVIA